MYYPGKKEFLKLAKKGNLIPVYKEIAARLHTPLSAFIKIDREHFSGKTKACSKFSYLLESSTGSEKIARYSFLGSNPSLIFMSKGRKITILEHGKKRIFETSRDPLTEIKAIINKFSYVSVEGLPRFSGGLVGYIGYDVIRFFEKIPDKNKDDLNLPDCLFALTDTILIFDHLERKIKIVSNAFVTEDAAGTYDDAVRKIEEIAGFLSDKVEGKKYEAPFSRAPISKKSPIKSNLSKTKFRCIVKKAKEYIKKGDVIQVVLSQRFKRAISSDPFSIYAALRSINPSPYMFYLDFGNIKLIGASPEIMVRCEDRIAELRPIAGTRPRGRSEKEDRRFEKELLKDPKERAEHIMLVDLGRNDIGRVCSFKSVKILEFMAIEKYSHVMHIVSDVSGVLKQDKDIFDLVKASFPAGTVTGAPKIRAMEIIDELENTKRGVYAGSVGYFSFSGNMDTCIAIRTIVVKGKTAYFQAGAGIVADSNPDKEYKETINKAKAMAKAIDKAEKGVLDKIS